MKFEKQGQDKSQATKRAYLGSDNQQAIVFSVVILSCMG